jgi:hypothetical protein
MASETFLVNDVNIEKINIGTVKTLSTGVKMAYVNFNGNSLRMQLPKMYLPYGFSDNRKFIDNEDNIKYWLNLSFADNDKINDLKELIENIENKVIDIAFENCQEWFKKNYKSKEFLEDKFTSSIVFSKDKATGERNDKYPPTFKVNMRMNNGKIATKFYNNSRKEINNITEIKTQGSNIISIIHGMFWISSSGFGISWKIDQGQIFLSDNNNGCIIKAVEGEQEEEEEDIDVSDLQINDNTNTNNTQVEDSDDDDDV